MIMDGSLLKQSCSLELRKVNPWTLSHPFHAAACHFLLKNSVRPIATRHRSDVETQRTGKELWKHKCYVMKMIQMETKLLRRTWDGTNMLMSLCKNASISQMFAVLNFSNYAATKSEKIIGKSGIDIGLIYLNDLSNFQELPQFQQQGRLLAKPPPLELSSSTTDQPGVEQTDVISNLMKLWAMEKMVPLPSNPSASLVLDVVHMWIHGDQLNQLGRPAEIEKVPLILMLSKEVTQVLFFPFKGVFNEVFLGWKDYYFSLLCFIAIYYCLLFDHCIGFSLYIPDEQYLMMEAELLRQQGIEQLTVRRQFTQTPEISIMGHFLQCCKDSLYNPLGGKGNQVWSSKGTLRTDNTRKEDFNSRSRKIRLSEKILRAGSEGNLVKQHQQEQVEITEVFVPRRAPFLKVATQELNFKCATENVMENFVHTVSTEESWEGCIKTEVLIAQQSFQVSLSDPKVKAGTTQRQFWPFILLKTTSSAKLLCPCFHIWEETVVPFHTDWSYLCVTLSAE
ncbi:hypothetical protein Q9966_008606 [Columba livia]|nr:hypothetical protein Q9966_008606 [Columba livia]